MTDTGLLPLVMQRLDKQMTDGPWHVIEWSNSEDFGAYISTESDDQEHMPACDVCCTHAMARDDLAGIAAMRNAWPVIRIIVADWQEHFVAHVEPKYQRQSEAMAAERVLAAIRTAVGEAAYAELCKEVQE